MFDFCDDAALYGVMTSGNNGQNTKAVRIDLTTGELQSVPLEPTEYFVTCYDGALLTVRYVTDAAPCPTTLSSSGPPCRAPPLNLTATTPAPASAAS